MRRSLLALRVLLWLAVVPATAFGAYPSTVTTETWVSTPGTHTVQFIATDGAGNVALPKTVHFTIFADTKLTSYVTSSTITSGKSTSFYGYLTAPIPMPVGLPVRIEKLSGTKWVYYYTTKTSRTPYGAKYQVTLAPKTTTTFRARYAGDGGAFRASVSPSRKVTVKAKTLTYVALAVAGAALIGAAAYAVKRRSAA